MERIWEQKAKKLEWFNSWKKILDWNDYKANWFVGGKLNASYLCLDKNLKNCNDNKLALIWENEIGEKETYSYKDLYIEVNKFAFSLKKIGVKKGDIIILYLPMIPQAIISMLAAARLGAIHSVVFSGFSSKALQDRINDTNAKFIITADYTLRRGKKIFLKNVVDDAVKNVDTIKNVILIKRNKDDLNNQSIITLKENIEVPKLNDKDLLYHEMIKDAPSYVMPEEVESNHPLFILYTSGTTGKPKGIMHSTGGYLVYTYSTFEECFGETKNEIYWCTGDIGWITGHSYIVYAPLMHGTTVVLYEGAPDFPDPSNWWRIIEKYKVSIFYTSPTAIRMFIKFGDKWIKNCDLSSLKLLGSVGEVINPAAWHWYFSKIGKNKCKIIDTWWQTETGGFMIAPTVKSKISDLKAGSAMYPLTGIDLDIVDESGKSVENGQKGYLIVRKPWPGIMIDIHNDSERYKQIYWSKFKDFYYSGDYAKKDKDGYYWLLGRADETLNIAGHRIGTAEIESAAIANELVAESAAVPIPDKIKGQNFVLFVVLRESKKNINDIKNEIMITLKQEIGVIARPAKIYFVNSLPKTRSGKILRRLLQDIVQNKNIGDVTTLQDEESIKEIKNVTVQL